MIPSVHDRISLWVLRAAKRRRRKYVAGEEQDFYREFFTEGDPEVCALDARRLLRNAEVRSALAGCGAGDVVVDLGCGVGDLLGAAGTGARRVGVDVSLAALAHARRAAPGAALVAGRLEQLPLASGAADAVVCLEVLEHVRDDVRALDEISRVLRPGGRVILSVPGRFYFEAYRELMGHWRHYTRASLEAMLRRAGLLPERTLCSYDRFTRGYLYLHVVLWVLAAVGRRVTRRAVTPYSLRLPGDRRSLYARLTPALLRLARWLARPGAPDTGGDIFLVAVKTESPPP